MNSFIFRFSPEYLSELVWRQVFENVEAELDAARRQILDIFDACEATRDKMDYNTGSIPLSTAFSLYCLTRHIHPKTVFEVGTFIGKSVLSMALAMDKDGPDGIIYTCDGSNEFHVPTKKVQTQIVGYSKTMSGDALRKVAAQDRKLDLMHIDGRVSASDLDVIAQLANPRVVVAVDDFEGFEKGVVNCSVLRQHAFFGRHVLVYPTPMSILSRFGLFTKTTTALLVPADVFQFTNQ